MAWKRARKVCEKHWRGLENSRRGCDGTSAVIALPPLTASTTMAFAANRAPDFTSRSDLWQRRLRSAKSKVTQTRQISLSTLAQRAHLFASISAVHSTRRSAYRRISHPARQAIAGQPGASVTSVGYGLQSPARSRRRVPRRAFSGTSRNSATPERKLLHCRSLNSPTQTPVRARCAQDSSISSKSAKADRRRRTHIVVIGQADAVGPSITVRWYRKSENRDATPADHLKTGEYP